jgi:ABC-type nitrate/sulfonate/bicarbonate transport system substrate-binding protein
VRRVNRLNRRPRHERWLAVTLMAAMLSALGVQSQVAGAAGAPPSVVQLTVGSASSTSPAGFVTSLVMQEIPGLYQRVGLSITIITIPLGQAVQLVQSGNPPVAMGPGQSNVASGYLHGATDVRIFAGIMQKSLYELVARRGITKMIEIKTLGVPSVASAASQNCQTILRSAGMQANRDYALVLLGNSAARVAALQAGKVDGSCEPLPYPEYYRDKYGMAVLAKTSAYLPYYATGAWVYSTKWAQDPAHRAALVRLAQAILLAHRWTVDPAHKSQVVMMAAKAFNVTEPYADLYYRELVDGEVLTPDGYVPERAAQSNEQDYANMGITVTPPSLSRYYDWSILQEAAAGLGIRIRRPEY